MAATAGNPFKKYQYTHLYIYLIAFHCFMFVLYLLSPIVTSLLILITSRGADRFRLSWLGQFVL